MTRPRESELLVPALLALAVHAACGGEYGLFRDELYFLACGQRLAAGYVDQPPLVAVVARLAHAAFDLWVPGLRLAAWLSHAGAAFLAGRLARRLGADRWGAFVAALAVAASPLLAALGHSLTMNAWEPLLWLAIAHLAVRVAQGDDPRLLAAAGALAGLGALNKYTAVLFVPCLVAGLTATPARRLLASRWALAGAALGLAAALPNAAWQAAHGFPFLEIVRNGQLHENAPFSLAGFALAQLRDPNALAAPLWLAGLGWLLLSRAARGVRFLGIAAALLLALLAAAGAKPYYAAPIHPLLFAAGAAAASRAVRHPAARAAIPLLLVAGFAAGAPLALPLLPEEAVVRWQARVGRPPPLERHREAALPQLLADQHGWEELARGVAELWKLQPRDVRENAVVFASNYGEAAALELLGPRHGLPRGVAVSGHNQYWLWGLPPGRGQVALVVSDEHEDCGGGAYAYRERLGALPESAWAMPWERGLVLWLCAGPERPLAELWARTRHYE